MIVQGDKILINSFFSRCELDRHMYFIIMRVYINNILQWIIQIVRDKVNNHAWHINNQWKKIKKFKMQSHYYVTMKSIDKSSPDVVFKQPANKPPINADRSKPLDNNLGE